MGVVHAALEDFSRGLLFNLKALVAAELLGEFLEQAEDLATEGYHVPATSLAGTVLGNGLRELCQKHSIPLAANTNIETLNVALAKAAVNDKLVQTRSQLSPIFGTTFIATLFLPFLGFYSPPLPGLITSRGNMRNPTDPA